jgi:acyl carrier protein phosphodiesterase
VNYLAHIYLSGDFPETMIGGLLGDFVKGPLRGERPKATETGISLHRKIDAFTDSLPEVKHAIARIEPPYRRFGGILINICYDHFLASNWEKFHHQPLGDYCQDFYRLLSEYEPHLPPGARRFSEVAPKVQWLEGYADMDKLKYILERVGQRFKTPIAQDKAFPQLLRDYQLLDQEFTQIFPKIIAFANSGQSKQARKQ